MNFKNNSSPLAPYPPPPRPKFYQKENGRGVFVKYIYYGLTLPSYMVVSFHWTDKEKLVVFEN